MNADVIVKALRHCYQEDIHGCEGCPLNDIDLCYGANLELSAADLIESLQAQLAKSQRRERAAVEDMKEAATTTGRICKWCVHRGHVGLCFSCKWYVGNLPEYGKDAFQWRGPQKGEPHETV